MKAILLAVMLLVGFGLVTATPLTLTAAAKPTCDPLRHTGDAGELVACVVYDLPCLPHPCG